MLEEERDVIRMVKLLSALLAFVLVAASSAMGVRASNPIEPLSVEQAAALFAYVSTAADPTGAFRSLGAQEQLTLRAYMTPYRFESAGAMRPRLRGGTLKAAAPMRDICDTVHNWVIGTNYYGVTVFQFNHEITWCYNGGPPGARNGWITNNPETRTWPSNTCCGWYYAQTLSENRYPLDGYGADVFTYQSDGQFRNDVGYAQNVYPGLRTEVWGDGDIFAQQYWN